MKLPFFKFVADFPKNIFSTDRQSNFHLIIPCSNTLLKLFCKGCFMPTQSEKGEKNFSHIFPSIIS